MAIAIFSVAVVYRFELLEVLSRWIYATTIFAFICGFLIARYVRLPKSKLWLVVAVPLSFVSVYACFARHRINASSNDASFPRNFPYPDNMIIESEQYWRTPPEKLPPDTIDFHGGMIETIAIIEWSAIICASIAGFMMGAAILRRSAR